MTWLAVSSAWRMRSKYATAEGRYSTPTPSSVGTETPRSTASLSSVSIFASSPFSKRYSAAREMRRRFAIWSAERPEASRKAFSRLPMSSKRIDNSIDLDVRFLHHALPFREIGLDDGGEVLRAARVHLAALAAHHLLGLRFLQCRRGLAVEQRDDLRRRARRRHEPGPQDAFVVRQPGLGNRRHARQRRPALRARHGEHLELAALLVRQRRGQGGRSDLEMPGHEVRGRGRAALVRN